MTYVHNYFNSWIHCVGCVMHLLFFFSVKLNFLSMHKLVLFPFTGYCSSYQYVSICWICTGFGSNSFCKALRRFKIQGMEWWSKNFGFPLHIICFSWLGNGICNWFSCYECASNNFMVCNISVFPFLCYLYWTFCRYFLILYLQILPPYKSIRLLLLLLIST